MGSSQLPEILEHWVSVCGLLVAATTILFGVFLVLDSFLPD